MSRIICIVCKRRAYMTGIANNELESGMRGMAAMRPALTRYNSGGSPTL